MNSGDCYWNVIIGKWPNWNNPYYDITTPQFTKTAYNLYRAKYWLFIDDPMPMRASVSLFDSPTQKKTCNPEMTSF